MSDRIEIKGKTVEAAVSEALLRLGARRDEVEIKVLEEPKSGFMGFLGGRSAKVLVRKKTSRGRGGSGRDYRVDDDEYQAHNLSGGRGRGSRRKPSGGSGGSGGARAAKDEGQDSGREEKGRSRRGSRGRGGRGRNQEAGGRTPRKEQPRQRGGDEQPVKADQQEQSGGRAEGGRSRNERGRRGAPGRQDAPRENGRESERENRRDSRRDSRPARQESPRAAERPEDLPSVPVEGRRNQRREAPAPVPAPVENTTPIETKEEIAVTTPPKKKRAFGGLGSRLKERRAAAKAAKDAASAPSEAPTEAAAPPAASTEPAVAPTPAPTPAPAREYSRDYSDNRNSGRRGPSRQADEYADEVILNGISGIKYAQPLGQVTEEGLDDALTELTDGLLARAGFPCRCETQPGEYRQIKVTTDDASAGMLIGRHGQTVDAVEHLVERMASNAIDARARINLDINNYRQRREETLAERVQEAAAAIRETGRPVHLEPMSARERRLVHMEAANIEGLRTFTMDRAGGKHVVIARDEAADGAEAGDERSENSE